MLAVAEKKMSMYSAAKQYKIPRTTLLRHIHTPDGKELKVGVPTVLSSADEIEIVSTCHLFAEWGFGLSKQDVVNVVTDYLKSTKKPNPFKDGIPGEAWWLGFLKRHPDLVKRKPQQLQIARARAAKPEIVNHWFIECLKPTLDTLGLTEKPWNIYNVDETGFPLSGNPGHILAKRGTKSPQAIIGGSGRENITVQVCTSATGKLLPPYIVYKRKYLMAENTNGGAFGTKY